jgi:MFS superfamily sulfate permease-like transporter
MKTLVAFTPITGAVILPLLVCLLMVKVNIATGVLAAVVISSLWFVAMLRTSELPEHG